MKDTKTIRKIFSGILVGGLLLGTGAAALAGTNDTGTSTQTNCTPSVHGPKMPGMEKSSPQIMTSVIDELVANSTITQAQADAITAKITALDTARKAEMDKVKAMTQAERETYFQQNKTEKTDVLTELVNDGTISSAQADSIKAAEQTKIASQRQEQINTALSALVTKGTITSDQSAAILAQIQQEQTNRKAEMDKIKAMSQTERDAYMQQNKAERTNYLDTLVTAGTLTQAQADAVSQALGQHDGHQGFKNHQAPMAKSNSNS